MPAARPNSSKSRKTKASSLHSSKPPSSKSPSSRPRGVKSAACSAWWCDSAFTRRADMLKHVSSEHFGKRFYCIICNAVMKQESNLNTHLNAHFGNHCTLCSCGQGFTDPSACTKHRIATGHEKGITYRQVRPTIVNPVKVQHLAGLALKIKMIADPNFIPPLFDESYHLKGMRKPKAQEKYNSTDYLVAEKPDDSVAEMPAVPTAQTAGDPPTDQTHLAEYHEPTPTAYPAPAQTEIQVDKLGLNVDFSYDVELLQEPQYGQVTATNVYSEHHMLPATHPTYDSQTPSGGYYTSPGAIPTYYPYPAVTSYTLANANLHSHPYPGSYPVAVNNYIPQQPQSFVELHDQPEYLEMFSNWQVAYPPCPVPPPSLEMPCYPNSFEMGFGMPIPEQFQHSPYQPQFQPYQPNFNFHNHVYQPALATY